MEHREPTDELLSALGKQCDLYDVVDRALAAGNASIALESLSIMHNSIVALKKQVFALAGDAIAFGALLRAKARMIAPRGVPEGEFDYQESVKSPYNSAVLRAAEHAALYAKAEAQLRDYYVRVIVFAFRSQKYYGLIREWVLSDGPNPLPLAQRAAMRATAAACEDAEVFCDAFMAAEARLFPISDQPAPMNVPPMEFDRESARAILGSTLRKNETIDRLQIEMEEVLERVAGVDAARVEQRGELEPLLRGLFDYEKLLTSALGQLARVRAKAHCELEMTLFTCETAGVTDGFEGSNEDPVAAAAAQLVAAQRGLLAAADAHIRDLAKCCSQTQNMTERLCADIRIVALSCAPSHIIPLTPEQRAALRAHRAEKNSREFCRAFLACASM
jgi:hypothetical protein